MSSNFFRKILTIFLAFVLVFSLVACGNNNTTNNNNNNTGETYADGREPVTLIMYTRFSAMPGLDEIVAEAQRRLDAWSAENGKS